MMKCNNCKYHLERIRVVEMNNLDIKSTYEKLKVKYNIYKEQDNKMKTFFNEYNIKNIDHLIDIVIDYNKRLNFNEKEKDSKINLENNKRILESPIIPENIKKTKIDDDAIKIYTKEKNICVSCLELLEVGKFDVCHICFNCLRKREREKTKDDENNINRDNYNESISFSRPKKTTLGDAYLKYYIQNKKERQVNTEINNIKDNEKSSPQNKKENKIKLYSIDHAKKLFHKKIDYNKKIIGVVNEEYKLVNNLINIKNDKSKYNVRFNYNKINIYSDLYKYKDDKEKMSNIYDLLSADTSNKIKKTNIKIKRCFELLKLLKNKETFFTPTYLIRMNKIDFDVLLKYITQ